MFPVGNFKLKTRTLCTNLVYCFPPQLSLLQQSQEHQHGQTICKPRHLNQQRSKEPGGETSPQPVAAITITSKGG